MPLPTRLCPSCKQTRSLNELYCEAILENGSTCGWSLLHVPISYEAIVAEPEKEVIAVSKDEKVVSNDVSSVEYTCENGHACTEDDFICLSCGADVITVESTNPDIGETPTGETPAHPPIDHWNVEATLDSQNSIKTCYAVNHADTNQKALLVLYPPQYKTDPAIYKTLEKTHHNHIPRLLETGVWEECSYEAHEWIEGGNLNEQAYFSVDRIDDVVNELGQALHDLSLMEIRHRNINPRAILVRTQEPLDLVITDFSSAQLSDFDLEIVASFELSRYSAPETIVGAVSIASDWWGLGIILLEQLTRGACFENVNDKAFMMHIVTRSIDIPDSLDSRYQHLLAGLLARDPQKRWQWSEVKLWLEGNPPAAPERHGSEHHTNQSIQLNDIAVSSPEQFALLAAQHEHWEAGNELFVHGHLATWCENNLNNSTIAAQLRLLRDDGSLEADYGDAPEINQDIKYSLALMILNPSIPLTYHGDIITPSWLLPNAQLSYRLLNSRVIDYLIQMEREGWLTHLKLRMDSIRKRSHFLEVELDEDKFQLMVLATSRANLDAEYSLLREIYPDAEQAGLIELLDKDRLNNEDLILLLSAERSTMTPLEEILQDAAALARQHDILVFDDEVARQQLIQVRSELYQQLSPISTSFSRCGHAILDGWMDDFRLQGRLRLPRILVLLSIPEEQWQQPEKQEYLNNLFRFFEKRVINNILRGSLVRLIIGKTTARIDLTELDTGLRSAKSLLEHVLDRGSLAMPLDPSAYQNKPLLNRRLVRAISEARTYRQETGIDSLFIGFPFVLHKEAGKTTRPRIAPLLLWPVAVDTEGSTHKLRFAIEREEIRLNPALEGILPADEYEKLVKARQELLRRNDISIQTVLDNFGSLFPLRHNSLVKHPSVDLTLESGETCIEPSAVLFNATFVGQAISEDLRRLRQLPIQDTALAAAFQVQDDDSQDKTDTSTGKPISENDKYFITPADPSQEKAILTSRTAPGLLIEGPPGTGKSQTIVNIISDCIGRKENVLVICQKQAALQVVAKRLEASSLQNRFLMINDINRDRQPTIRTLREQLESMGASNSESIESKRQALANKIDRLEERLNDYHHHLYERDTVTNHSYRQVLNELISLEELHGDKIIDVPSMRHLLEETSTDTLNTLLEDIEPLAHNWLLSEYEDSPLHALTVFSTDTALVNTLTSSLQDFFKTEQQREETLRNISADFDELSDNDAGKYQRYTEWSDRYASLFLSLDDAQRKQIATWFNLFESDSSESEGDRALLEIQELQAQLMTQSIRQYDSAISPVLQNKNIGQVKKWHKAAEYLQQPKRWYSAINLVRFLHNRQLSSLNQSLSSAALDSEDTHQLETLRKACQLEFVLRPLRQSLKKACEQLDYSIGLNALTLNEFRQATQKLIGELELNQQVKQAVSHCPRPKDAKTFISLATESAYNAFFDKFSAAIQRASAREDSLEKLEVLSPWFETSWMNHASDLIADNHGQLDNISSIINASSKISAFQYFRLRAQDKPALLFDILAQFRTKQSELESIDAAVVGQVLKESTHSEALLSWKSRLERQHPALLINKQDTATKIAELASTANDVREVTQKTLRHNIDNERIGASKHWEAITRLRGARYKKLREFIDEGMDLGLMEIRPVWLMSPEVASQALPLKANLFDVVIYDEASQLMVDYAIPSLYRAKRAIISGDEKQMPPTSFFSSKTDSDEDISLLEMSDDLSASERVEQEEAWERHEIKDQSDLLSLGRSFLPCKTLQIHYRSQYESLITFSNYAFYNGQLNIPRKHPETEILRAKPLEVIRADGEYIQQTNPTEAERIVGIIEEYWKQPESQRPTIGVVTFNKKQAELITDHILLHAETNAKFEGAYLKESQRLESGEDMGFFVKNVENVQGDERDIMIFSTTFGYDANGSFYRRFGALGQAGGERRLNVAITRAKQKVILVTSMPIDKISDALATGHAPNKPRDYLQLYLDFASKMSNGDLEVANYSAKKLSPRKHVDTSEVLQDSFVRSVARYLESEGFAPTSSQASGDSFQLDLAIEHPETGLFALGIECDSPQHELLTPATAREIWRPSVLKQSIQSIHRINSRDWYHHRQVEQENLLASVNAALVTTLGEEQ